MAVTGAVSTLPLEQLSVLLRAHKGARIALLGADNPVVVDTLRRALAEKTLESAATDADWFAVIPELADCAVVYVRPGVLPAAEFEHRAAALRDRCRGLLIVEENNAAPVLTENHYFSLGFRRQSAAAGTDSGVKLYIYSLRDYKSPPDWLNAKYWAHPERWDLSD